MALRRCLSLIIVGAVAASCTGGSEGGDPTEPDPRGSPRTGLHSERIPIDAQPLAIVYDDGNLWVTAGGGGLLRIEDGAIVARYSTAGLSRVGITSAAGRIWMTGGGDGGEPDGTMVGIEPEGGGIVQEFGFPRQSPYGIDSGPKGIYVALFQGQLVRLHPGGDATSSAPLGRGLTQVLVAQGKVWVSQPGRGNVWNVEFHDDDTSAARTELRYEAERSCPQGLDSSERYVWVADPCARRVWLLDPADGRVGDAIDGVGRRPVDVAIGDGLAWVVSSRDAVVSVIDLETLVVLGRAEAGDGATAIAASGGHAWVANSEDGSLTHLVLRSASGAPLTRSSPWGSPVRCSPSSCGRWTCAATVVGSSRCRSWG